MTNYCDNRNKCHDPIEIGEDESALLWYCRECHQTGVIYKDLRGVPDNVEYARVYKRLILQGSDDLLYRYYPQHLRI